ncbi:hypothetical protein MTO96_051806 [Rhipicephalus appendiculatus]
MTATRLYSALPGCVTSGCFPRRCRGAQTDGPYISDAPGRDEANAIGCVPGTRAHRSVHSVPHSVCGRPMTQMRNDCGNLYATPAGLPSPTRCTTIAECERVLGKVVGETARVFILAPHYTMYAGSCVA